MCGILGTAGNNLDKEKINYQSMISSLSKRGPDDNGWLCFTNCCLGQTRLSIIDLSGGHQPMQDSKNKLAITFNGEIYNFLELKKELTIKGHEFTTNSDTEVILKAYAEYGEKCVERLDGMFAFAIWNENRKELFLARDRFGKKPLYYSFDKNNNIVFASEIKTLFFSGLIKGELDYSVIDNYLQLLYVPPHKSIYKNIKVVEPATYLFFKKGKIAKQKYWELKYDPINISYEEAKEEIKTLLNKAVKKRMIADVEIGALLSGGVDSTLLTYLAQKYSDHKIKTFSLGYENFINELPYAQQASEKIGTDHYYLQADKDFIKNLFTVIEYFDEPHADSSNFPQYLISRLASSKVKVVLSGDGADELFMGYGWYWKHFHIPFTERLLQKIFSNPFDAYIKLVSIFNKQDRKKIWQDASFISMPDEEQRARSTSLESIKKINYFDLTCFLPGALLTKVDRASMMNSLETRCPFLDTALVEFVYNLPLSYKMSRTKGKIILKDILAEVMPLEFVHRRKQGFGAPVKDWLKKEELKNAIYDKLYNNAESFAFLKKQRIRKIIDNFYNENDYQYHYQIWVLLCLEIWLNFNKKNITNL